MIRFSFSQLTADKLDMISALCGFDRFPGKRKEYERMLKSFHRLGFVLMSGERPVGVVSLDLCSDDNDLAVIGKRVFLSELSAEAGEMEADLTDILIGYSVNKALDAGITEMTALLDEEDLKKKVLMRKYAFTHELGEKEKDGRRYKLLLRDLTADSHCCGSDNA